MLRLRVVVALAALSLVAVPAAQADGDPASDVLPTADVYFPIQAPSGATQSALSNAVAQVYANGDRVKVAVIATIDDMGAVPSLFNKPPQYAQFLGQELAGFYEGPLLIVQPNGFGIYDGGRSTSAEDAVLNGLSVDKSSSDSMTQSAVTAVQKLEAAGALKSPDVKPPYVYPDPATVHLGKPVTLTFRVLDDSEHASATITITAGAKTVATITQKTISAVYTKQQSAVWAVPKKLPAKGVKLCLSATDPSGNKSAPTCVPIKVKAR
jgi:hypothetical protein